MRRLEVYVVGGLVLFVVGLTLVSVSVGAQGVLDQVARISGPMLAGLLALSLINYGTRALRWSLFCEAMACGISFRRSLLYFVSGFAMTATPGKVGEALRLWLMRRGHGTPYERSAGVLVADRLSDTGAILGLVVLSGLAGLAGHALPVLVAAVMLAGLLALGLRPGLLPALIGWLYGAIGRGPRVFAKARRSVRACGRLLRFGVFGPGLALGLAGWFAEAAAFWWLLQAFDADIGLAQATFVFAFSLIVGSISFMPGGLGSTEATMIGLLLALGVGAEAAVAATGIIRLTTLWFAIFIGCAVLPFAMRMVGRARP